MIQDNFIFLIGQKTSSRLVIQSKKGKKMESAERVGLIFNVRFVFKASSSVFSARPLDEKSIFRRLRSGLYPAGEGNLNSPFRILKRMLAVPLPLAALHLGSWMFCSRAVLADWFESVVCVVSARLWSWVGEISLQCHSNCLRMFRIDGSDDIFFGLWSLASLSSTDSRSDSRASYTRSPSGIANFSLLAFFFFILPES